MKKSLCAALLLSMTLALAGCAGGQADTTEAETTEEATAAETETTEDAAEETADAAEETAEEAAPAEVMTHEEYMAAEIDSQVTVESYVQGTQSWWEDEGQGKITVYAQSEDGAYFFYELACTEEDAAKLVPGTKIRVTGYKAEWSGEVEVMDGTFEFVEDGEEFIADPLDVTEMLGTDELINHQNEFVSFTGMTVEPAQEGSDAAFLYSYDGSGSDGDDLYFNASYNGQTYTFTIESYLCDNTTDVYNAVEELQVGDVIDMQGYLYWYEGVNPHITYVGPAASAETVAE